MPYTSTYVFLRPGDTIYFPTHSVTVRTMFVEDSTPERGSESKTLDAAEDPAVKSEVQVKSSNIEPETIIGAKEEDATDTEDEDDDLGLAFSARSAQTPGVAETTPATLRPTELTIKETPKHTNLVFMDDAQPYSTAPDKLIEDAEPCSEAESPSVTAQRSKTATSQVRASAKLVDTVDGTPSDSDAADELDFDTSKKVAITYSHRKKRDGEPGTSDLPDTDPPVPYGELDVDDAEEGMDVVVEQIIAPTSDPMNDHEVAIEAAKRTLLQGSIKRKASDQDGEDEQDAATVSKRQKLDEASAVIETPTVDDDETDGEEPPELEPKAKSGKLKKPARRQSQESGEEIAVAAKISSPEVVIKPHRMSETPSSSATLSSLTGKVPKILLSSESAVQKNPAVKKWLKKMGAAIIDNVPSRGTYFVCVVTKEHSLKSAKVLHSLAMGRLVVTDDWLTDSKTAGEILDPTKFVHKALEENITHNRRRIFSGKRLFFTSPLVSNYKDGWSDIQEVAKEAGAIEVDKVPFNKPTYLRDYNNVVLFGGEKADNDVSRLISEHGRTVYSKELFTHSILSGELVLDDEFKLTGSAPVKKGRRS